MNEANHTPGPWTWCSTQYGSYLGTPDRGRLVVMDFAKHPRGVEPRFATWDGPDRGRMGGVMVAASKLGGCSEHPDARLIASAPALFAALSAYVTASSRMADRWSEGDVAVQQELWRELMGCEAKAREVLG